MLKDYLYFMRIEETWNKRILFAALNWGMGHVSRSISIIFDLLKADNTIVIAASETQQIIFKEYFPDLIFEKIHDYPFRFGGKGNFASDVLRSSFAIYRHMRWERKFVDELLLKHEIDMVISDHRYGFYAEKVPSVFITHQLNLPVRWFESMADIIHTRLMKKFDQIWVVDREDNFFAGKLSINRKGFPVSYIGPRSRFEGMNSVQQDYDVAIISGPSPYDQQLLNLVLVSPRARELKVVSSKDLIDEHKKIDWVRGGWKEKDEVIRKATVLISRSGYSTIMDAWVLGKKLEMIPTPGQREQHYLYEIWKDRFALPD